MSRIGTRAQSQIITTILLILIVLAAAAIIWMYVRPLFGKLGGEQNNCIKIELIIEKADADANLIRIYRKAGGEENDVTGVKLVINGDIAELNSVDGSPCAGDGCDTSLKRLERKDFGVVQDFTEGAEIQVAAAVGEKMLLCEISDTAKAS